MKKLFSKVRIDLSLNQLIKVLTCILLCIVSFQLLGGGVNIKTNVDGGLRLYSNGYGDLLRIKVSGDVGIDGNVDVESKTKIRVDVPFIIDDIGSYYRVRSEFPNRR